MVFCTSADLPTQTAAEQPSTLLLFLVEVSDTAQCMAESSWCHQGAALRVLPSLFYIGQRLWKTKSPNQDKFLPLKSLCSALPTLVCHGTYMDHHGQHQPPLRTHLWNLLLSSESCPTHGKRLLALIPSAALSILTCFFCSLPLRLPQCTACLATPAPFAEWLQAHG